MNEIKRNEEEADEWLLPLSLGGLMMEIVKRFEHYLLENGIAPKTIESYVGDVEKFNQYLKEQNVDSVEQLKRFYMMSYKKRLIDEGYAIATINKKINSLQAYNFFLMKTGIVSERVVFLGKESGEDCHGQSKGSGCVE
jgi:integrase/recombinase XerD